MATNCRAIARKSREWSTRSFIVFVWMIGCLSGCNSSTINKDGSSGSLLFGVQALGDICVVVHRKKGSEFQSPGFGTTDHTGAFYLLSTGGQDALTLEPGEYSFTLESPGPQIVFPANYLNPETTPLKVIWTAEMTSLDLNVPEELLANLPK